MIFQVLVIWYGSTYDSTESANILIEEAKNQVKLGRETAVFDLGDFLEHLKNQMNVAVPQDVLNTLFTFVEKQAEAKIHK
ncbi:hypothetical protein J4219_08235 [Candidatus Woesearchaeota archaeon]|nr:hypothetical protein [Candidatus Woesearchaeota archaeon]